MDGAGLLRSVVDCLDSRLCVISGDGRVLDTNSPWDDAWRSEVDDPLPTVGDDVFTLLDVVLPTSAAAALRGAVRKVVDGADYQVVRGQRRRRDADEYFIIRVHPVRGHDQARAALMYVDITESYLAQERLRRLTDHAHREVAAMAGELASDKALLSEVVDSIPHLVYWKDNDLRYAGVNRAFLGVRGLAASADVLGRTDTELGLTDDIATALAGIEEDVLRTGQPRLDVQVTYSVPDEPARQLLLGVLPRSRAAGIIGVAADVTQVRELERHLALAGRLESIGQLAAGIAHEINTPIQFVSDNVSFLSETFAALLPVIHACPDAGGQDLDLDFVAEEVPAALAQSQEGLIRVKEIVRAMRDFSHPRSDLAPSDLNRAVESTVQVSKNEWKYVADVELDLDPAVGLVDCFEGELKQVFLNMIVNAAQALKPTLDTRGGKGHIRVRTSRDRDTVVVTIADDGPGMTDDVRRRIFEPFFTTKDVGQGTGQGLALAQRIVVGKHHGTLDVDSAPDRGAVFTMRLPSPLKPGEEPGPMQRGTL